MPVRDRSHDRRCLSDGRSHANVCGNFHLKLAGYADRGSFGTSSSDARSGLGTGKRTSSSRSGASACSCPASTPRRAEILVPVATAAVALLLLVLLFFLRSHKRVVEAPATPPPVAVEPAAAPVAPTTTIPTPPAPPEPSVPALKLSSDNAVGKVSFDDQPPADLQDAQWALDKIPAGDHKLKFENRSGSFEFGLTSSDGALPLHRIAAQGQGHSGSAGKQHGQSGSCLLQRSCCQGESRWAARQRYWRERSRLSFRRCWISRTDRDPRQRRLQVVDRVGPTPLLNAFVESGENVGTLVVVTGQDKSKVFLNGKPLDRQTKGGQLRIPNLEPKEYSVRVAKEGYQDVAEQKIRIRKGQLGRLVFGLLPVPRMASLSIQGGPSGAAVFVDQMSAGAVQSDGTLNLSTIAPGDRVIELRKDGFKTKQIRKHFVAGSPVVLAASDTALEREATEFKITFTPSDAQAGPDASGRGANPGQQRKPCGCFSGHVYPDRAHLRRPGPCRFDRYPRGSIAQPRFVVGSERHVKVG